MRNTRTTTLAAALVLASVSIAAAQEENEAMMDMDMDMNMMHGCMQAMSTLDADEDGEISEEEFMQAHAEMFAAMDKNGDGNLTGDEQMMMEGMRHHKMNGKE